MRNGFHIEIPEDDENQPNHSSPPPTPRGDLSPPESPPSNPSFPQTSELHVDTMNNNTANEQQEASGDHYPYSHNGYSGAYGCAHM